MSRIPNPGRTQSKGGQLAANSVGSFAVTSFEENVATWLRDVSSNDSSKRLRAEHNLTKKVNNVQFSPRWFEQHSVDVVRLLHHPSGRLRKAAFVILSSFSNQQFYQTLPQLHLRLVKMLKGESEFGQDARRAAAKTLAQLEPDKLAKVSGLLLATMDGELKSWNGDEDVLVSIFQKQVEVATDHRNSWLHLAAERNQIAVCNFLLDRQICTRGQRNSKGQTASEVASACGNTDLAEELQPSVLEMRGGTGGAFATAWDCEDHVKLLNWYTLPLRRWRESSCCQLPDIGLLGGRHSLLKIAAGQRHFLIECAYPEEFQTYGEAREEVKEARKNGLFVSMWADVEDSKDLEKLLHVPTLIVPEQKTITFKKLIRHLLAYGPYNACTFNCHDCALAAYNFCAKQCRKPVLSKMPVNNFLCKVARLGLPFGIASGTSVSQRIVVHHYSGVTRDEIFTGEIPRSWTREVQDGFITLATGSEEWREIERCLKRNGGDEIPDFQILEIQHNQNLEMLKDFRNELRKVHGQRLLQLLHAPGDKNHDVVAARGFANAYANMNYNAYGAGFYFAQDLRLSDYFATGLGQHAGPDRPRKVLLCGVAVGKSFPKERLFPPQSGASDHDWRMKLAEPEHRKPPEGFNSCIAAAKEDELIVYEGRQIYVEFSITYKSSGFAGDPYRKPLCGSLKKIPCN